MKSGKIYENAFEWRFEFPEVLNDDGDFVGFDVVVGNPPYGYNFLSEAEKQYLKVEYTLIHQKMFETSAYFTKKGYDLLKNQGILSFITPNNLIYQLTFENFRSYIIDKTKIIVVMNLGDNIFDEADVPTCIFLFKKSGIQNNKNKFLYADIRSNDFLSIPYYSYVQSNINDVSGKVFGVSPKISELIKNVSDLSYLFNDISKNISYGIGSGGDKIFRIKENIINRYNLEKEILFKVISGNNIAQYAINYMGDFIIYTTKKIDISDYPNIKSYLNPYESKLSNKRETKKGILPWWCLHWPRNEELYASPKIVLRQTGDTIIATLDKKRRLLCHG